MFGTIIADELRTIADKFAEDSGLKHKIYLKADEMLAEGQSISKEKIDEWFITQRAKLKLWAGE